MNKSEIEQLRGLVIERVDMSREPDDSELHEIIDSVIEKYTLSLHDALPIRSEERRVGKECIF